MKFQYFAVNDIGQREENQDRYKVIYRPDGLVLAIVADGMGGHRGGSEAAEKVINACQHASDTLSEITDKSEFLLQLVALSHSAVCELNKGEHPQAQSTLAVLLLSQEEAISVHVGDCRVMEVSENGFIKRTIDQSMAQLHALKGDISEAEIATHPDQNKIYSSIGGAEPPRPVIEQFQSPRHCFFVCSDGFWELFTNDELLPLINLTHNEHCLQEQVTTKLESQEQHDNTTVILLHPNKNEQTSMGSTSANNNFKALFIVGVILVLFALILFFTLPESPSSASQPLESSVQPSEQLPSKDNTRGKEQVGEVLRSSDEGNIPSVRLPLEIDVDSTDDAVGKTEGILRSQGNLGQHDKLERSSTSKPLGDSEIIKQHQTHKGIRVYGAEAIAIVQNGKLISIDSKTVADIDVAVEPELSSAQALALASEDLQDTLRALAPAELIIFKKQQTYLLAWKIATESKDAKHIIYIIDANSAAILSELSLQVGGNHE